MGNEKSTATGQTTRTTKTGQASGVSKDNVPRRRTNIKTVQNVLLIWLDSKIDEKKSDYQNAITQLRCVINDISTFTDGDDCFQFLDSIHDDKLFMIISGSLGKVVAPCVHNMSQVDAIFIFCGNKKYHEEWAGKWPKIKGVFTEIAPICDALKQAAQQCEQNSISMSFMPNTGDMANKNLNQLEPSFMYTQIMKEILLTITFEEQHFRQFIDYCSEALANNPSELQNVQKIKQKYQQKTPIWWYTYECFLYPMLNRALRTLDADLIVTLGFFIKDLHLQIEQLHNEEFNGHSSKKTFIVYRGQGMAKQEFDKMTKTKGGLLSFNCFLSTSKKRKVSFTFAQRAVTNPNLVGILFVMTIDPSQSTTPFVQTDKVSYYKHGEKEILFSMHTVFRINDITLMDENQRLFQVNLRLTSDNDPDLRVLTNRIRKETFPNEEGWYRLGLTLLKIGQSKKADEIYQILLKHATTEEEKACIYHQMGWAKETQEDYQEAIICYEESLEIKKKMLFPNDLSLASTYNNIGIVYYNMSDFSKALLSHEKALAIKQQSLPPNHPDLASTYNNIGLVYDSMGEYSKALSSYEKALAIKQQSLPPNHPSLASTYNNIGLVYDNMGEYSKALSSYKKALTIKQQSLPPNHPSLASTYNNIDGVYSHMDEYSKALSSYEKALATRPQSLPPSHCSLASTYNNVGSVDQNMDEHSKAPSSHKKSLTIAQQSLPPDQPDLASDYNNIGLLYENMGEYSKACSFFQRALDFGQCSLPTTHPTLQQYQNNLDRVKTKM